MKRPATTVQALSESSLRFAITEFLSVDGRGLYEISAFEGRRLGFLGFRIEPSISCRGYIVEEPETTKFRQAWIDTLRDEVSKFVGIAATLISAAEIVNEEDEQISECLLSKVHELGKLAPVRIQPLPPEARQ